MAYTDPANFTYTNPNLATLFYNTNNGIFNAVLSAVSGFLTEMNKVCTSQIDETETIVVVLSCIFGLLIFFQAPMGCMMNKVVNSQVDIFLRLPCKACMKLERSANDFVVRAHVSLGLTSCRTTRTFAAKTTGKTRPRPRGRRSARPRPVWSPATLPSETQRKSTSRCRTGPDCRSSGRSW